MFSESSNFQPHSSVSLIGKGLRHKQHIYFEYTPSKSGSNRFIYLTRGQYTKSFKIEFCLTYSILWIVTSSSSYSIDWMFLNDLECNVACHITMLNNFNYFPWRNTRTLTHTHTHIYTHIHSHTHTYIYINMYMCVYVCLYTD